MPEWRHSSRVKAGRVMPTRYQPSVSTDHRPRGSEHTQSRYTWSSCENPCASLACGLWRIDRPVVGNDIPRAGVARLTKSGALCAQRLTARPGAAVLGLDVVPGVALRVVVMHVRRDGVPG